MTIVKMPQLGESVTEGTIIQWFKQPGDPVKLDEPLCEIETEKVTAELPAEFEGTMGRILVPQGETVEVGVPLCEIDVAAAPAAHAAALPAAPAAAAPARWSGGPMAIPPEEPPVVLPVAAMAAVSSAAPVAAAPKSPRTNPEDRSRYYSPAVMRLATERGIDLSQVTGSGIGGRITRKDIEAFIPATPSAVPATPAAAVGAAPSGTGAAYQVVALSPTRKTIAEHLTRSNVEAPQAWTMVECDVTGLVARRTREKERFEQQEGFSLTLLPYFTAAVCETLREYPMLNARWEGGELRHYAALNVAIAVATETGLVTPVVRDAGDLSIFGLAKRFDDLTRRAHARKLRLEDIDGGTFTVNNTGSFGSIASKPIVNVPQVAIVTMERAVKRPVVMANDAIAVRSMMNVCLSFDHRALDGFEAGGFLAALKRRLEAIE
ncbi:MAG TPA: dihydrolipoamide acetyltransferase family protein [Tepidiformaceae bacterium]|nr:dihydrolipoamide acetyltransferase family protein [Tepidiformaceae bacterium]